MNHQPRVWPLQEAKAKFSELVRLAQTEGPQTVTVHGEPAVTIIETPRDKAKEAGLTGADLLRALMSGPPIDFEIPPRPKDSTSRDFSFE
jgi:prevent-host-death family protein